MLSSDTETDLDADRGDGDETDDQPSVLEGALAGLSGLALGATIIYFAFPYCVNC